MAPSFLFFTPASFVVFGGSPVAVWSLFLFLRGDFIKFLFPLPVTDGGETGRTGLLHGLLPTRIFLLKRVRERKSSYATASA